MYSPIDMGLRGKAYYQALLEGLPLMLSAQVLPSHFLESPSGSLAFPALGKGVFSKLVDAGSTS